MNNLYLPFQINGITLDTDEGTKVVRRREVFVTKDDDGVKMVTSFGASLTDVASALRHHGWAVFPPESIPTPMATMRTYGEARTGRTRTGDHATSEHGATIVAVRAKSQIVRLLRAYKDWPYGLTDEEAAGRANLLTSCYWKRAGELREDGMIETVPGHGKDGVVTRTGSAGAQRIVCRITDAGRAALTRLDT